MAEESMKEWFDQKAVVKFWSYFECLALLLLPVSQVLLLW